MLTSHLASARRYGDQNLVFLAPSFLNWMRMPGKEKCQGTDWKFAIELKGTFNEADQAKDGKEGEDVGGVHMERCVHCLAACW